VSVGISRRYICLAADYRRSRAPALSLPPSHSLSSLLLAGSIKLYQFASGVPRRIELISLISANDFAGGKVARTRRSIKAARLHTNTNGPIVSRRRDCHLICRRRSPSPLAGSIRTFARAPNRSEPLRNVDRTLEDSNRGLGIEMEETRCPPAPDGSRDRSWKRWQSRIDAARLVCHRVHNINFPLTVQPTLRPSDPPTLRPSRLAARLGSLADGDGSKPVYIQIHPVKPHLRGAIPDWPAVNFKVTTSGLE